MRGRNRFALSCMVIVMACAGCGPSEPPVHDVSGAITFDGQPLPDGEIVFVSDDGRVSELGRVKEGRYVLKTTTGKKAVRIRAMKVKPGGARDAFGAAAPENYLPPRYNDQTILEAAVGPGANQFDFQLESKLTPGK